MDGEKSFYPHSQGIEYLLNESKVAFMETGDVIRSVNKVKTILVSFWHSIGQGHDENVVLLLLRHPMTAQLGDIDYH